ncbi:MAG: SMC-Scp complex subunit ScpB [candidate division KSB1 bacterium]|nr:SMC-Scp complex subunit ScpB [candidate division KSB1 bacterium]MDZ7334267.1 SMC-Scp complex subunit ScpB [candidate division KSB1 bacterium]MDZ7356335.1 SMC-Scp complex subunit ScpB [candidate division KSB1 bacterium]MDZ7377178.1 SMC-Scp complex subunit ScpB [candidate division KSB1 bacterium]MDZ7401027.1 SMC-Scp complex subunit ScpB [candidate division KSB1 bacterium]
MIAYKELKPIVEALIFASDTPITEQRIKSVISELETTDIETIVAQLNEEYDQHGHAFKIARLAGGYQFITRSDYAQYIKQYYKGRTRSKLSRAALETLAIIAFKQPISRPEIDAIRGVNSDGVVKNLLERNLIYISGRSDQIGHALLYSTTQEFLQYFGINSIADLPRPKEIEELLGSGQEELPLYSDEVDEKVVERIADLDEVTRSDDETE